MNAAAVILITVLGAVLRVTSAGRGPLWRDEAQFLHIVDLPSIGRMLEFLRLHESHPPLFYLMMRGWRGATDGSMAAAQALPLVLSVALVPAVYAVGARAFSRPIGLLAAFLTAVSPALIFTSVQLRPYALVSLLMLGSCYALWRALSDGQKHAWAWYAALAVAMLLTHHFGWLVLAAQATVVVACTILPNARPNRAALVRVAIAWLVIACAYLPMLSTFRYQMEHAGYPPTQSQSVVYPVRHLLAIAFDLPWEVGSLVLLTVIAAPLVTVCVARSRLDERAESRRALALLGLVAPVAVGGGLLAGLRSQLLLPQTLMTLLPFAMLLLAFILVRSASRGGAQGVILVQGVIGALMLGWLIAGGRVKSNARDVAAQVGAQARQPDLLVIAPGAMASSFNFYYRGPQQQIAFPEIGLVREFRFDDAFDRVGSLQAYREVEDTIRAAWHRNARVWFITIPLRDTVIVDRELPRESHGALGQADYVRAVQLGLFLTQLYGPPDSLPIPRGGRWVGEMTRALLFERAAESLRNLPVNAPIAGAP